MSFLDQSQHLSFAHYDVSHVQSGKFDLPGVMDSEVFAEPVVKRSVVLEFEGAERVSDAFDGVGLAVSEIIGRIDLPFVACFRMICVNDSVDHRVSHIQVGGRHIYFRPQSPRTILELSDPHFGEEIEVFFNGTIAKATVLTRFG